MDGVANMPPFLALAICLGFVGLLLRLEKKQAPEASYAMWIPTLWLLIASSRQIGDWFGQSIILESGSPLDRNLLLAILGISLLILFRRHFSWSNAIKANTWISIILSYMTISILWSPMAFISIKRWTREFVAIIMAFLILSEKNPREALLSLFRRTIYILLPCSLLLIKFFPSWGRIYNWWTGELIWTGVSSQKNGLALLCVLSIFFIFWELRQRLKGQIAAVIKYQIYIELLLVLLSFWLLGGPNRSLTYSATSTIVLLVGILFFASLLWINNRRIKLNSKAISLIFILIAIYGSITPFLGHLSLFDVSSLMQRDSTLTTRSTHIWAPLIPYAKKSPIVGYGVGGFWTTAMRELTSTSAHNGYLEIILHYGLIGLALFLLFILSCVKTAMISLAYDNNWGILFLCLLLMFLVYNITESTIHTLTSNLTALVLFFSIMTPVVISNSDDT